MKLGVNLDISSFSWAAFGSAITIFVGWIISFLKLRKDERVIEIENITKERKEWRTYLRKWLEEVSSLDVKTLNDEKKLEIRAQFISRINLIDRYDRNILELLDKILDSSQNENNIIINLKKELHFQISLLLKHDWERVKNETKPFYRMKKTEAELNQIREFGLNLQTSKTNQVNLLKNKLNNNFDAEKFDMEVTKELCTQVTLFPLIASVILIFHAVEKNYQFNFDEKFIHWIFIIVLNFIFAAFFSGILNREKATYWLKYNLILIIVLGLILLISLFFLNDLNLRGLDGIFIVMTSIVASIYTVVVFRSFNLFYKKLINYTQRVFAIAIILAIEFFIIISVFSL